MLRSINGFTQLIKKHFPLAVVASADAINFLISIFFSLFFSPLNHFGVLFFTILKTCLMSAATRAPFSLFHICVRQLVMVNYGLNYCGKNYQDYSIFSVSLSYGLVGFFKQHKQQRIKNDNLLLTKSRQHNRRRRFDEKKLGLQQVSRSS